MRSTIIIILLALIIYSCSDTGCYECLIDQLNDLEQNGEFDHAKDLVKSGIEAYPDMEFDLLKELIYINEKLGYYEENLDLFKRAHTSGYFFLIHPGIPKYKPYLEFNDFALISERDLELRDSANSVSLPAYDIILPASYRKKKNYPAIFIFHGGGSNIDKSEAEWKSEKLDQTYLKVFLQSPRHSDYNTFGWRNSDSIAVSHFSNIYKLLLERYSIDTNRIVAAGISAGGTASLYATLKSAVPVNTYLGVCNGIPELLDSCDYMTGSDLRVLMVTGENDHYRGRQERLIEKMDKYGFDYNYTVIKGIGHEYPPDFGSLLDSLLVR